MATPTTLCNYVHHAYKLKLEHVEITFGYTRGISHIVVNVAVTPHQIRTGIPEIHITTVCNCVHHAYKLKLEQVEITRVYTRRISQIVLNVAVTPHRIRTGIPEIHITTVCNCMHHAYKLKLEQVEITHVYTRGISQIVLNVAVTPHRIRTGIPEIHITAVCNCVHHAYKLKLEHVEITFGYTRGISHIVVNVAVTPKPNSYRYPRNTHNYSV